MNILLISVPLLDNINGHLMPIAMDARKESPPYGVYLLSSVLRSQGHEVHVADLIAQGSKDLSPFLDAIKSADLIGLGATSLSWPTAKECIVEIREIEAEVPIVLGGIHASMFDEYLMNTNAIDFIIRGEAEAVLPLLCDALMGRIDVEDVPSLTSRTKDGQLMRTPLRRALTGEEIGRFPVADYSLLPQDAYCGLSIESSRGCPFNCCFCSTSYRNSWRGIPPDIFVDRVEMVCQNLEKTRLRLLYIADDEFSTNWKRAAYICRQIVQRNISPKMIFNARVNDFLHEELLEAVSPLAHRFLIGAESGYDEGLRKTGKGTTCIKIEEAARLLKEYDLQDKCDFSFILALPWETKEDVIKTARFACRLHAKYGVRVMLQWYCQIPGSRLWAESYRQQNVSPALYDHYGFFQNVHLFRTGVPLTPKEVYEITEMLTPVIILSKVRQMKSDNPISYAHPAVLSKYFPDFSDYSNVNRGIDNLISLSDNTKKQQSVSHQTVEETSNIGGVE